MALTVPTWTLGDRMAKARRAAGLSVTDMADALGVTRKTINNYERGRSPVTNGTLIAWASITGVPYGWLTGEGGEGDDATRPIGDYRRAGYDHDLPVPALAHAS